jgi:carboxylesterase
MQKYVLHNPHLEGGGFLWEAGPVGVLLVHGYTATAAEVRPFARKLHEKGFTVGGPLLAGHGSRPEDLNRVRWQDWVESGEKSYRLLTTRCETVFLGGQSMGGLVALFLAGSHPDARGVLLYAPAIRLTMSASDRVLLYASSLFLAHTERRELDASEQWQGYHPELPLKGIIQLLRFQEAVRNRLSLIGQPVIVFQGRKDLTVAPDAGDIILRGVRSAIKEHHWMDESAHPILLDRELDSVTDLSLDFIDRVMRFTN